MDTLKPQSNGSLYSNTVIGTLHWPLMGGLLHLVQPGGASVGCGLDSDVFIQQHAAEQKWPRRIYLHLRGFRQIRQRVCFSH